MGGHLTLGAQCVLGGVEGRAGQVSQSVTWCRPWLGAVAMFTSTGEQHEVLGEEPVHCYRALGLGCVLQANQQDQGPFG